MTTEKAVPMPHTTGRWMIVNKETGEILDDAQGYGYRTAQKAHAAWSYKHPTPKQSANHAKNRQANKDFCKRHPKIGDLWAEVALDAFKNGSEPGYNDFKSLAHEVEPDFQGNCYSLYCYVQKHG